MPSAMEKLCDILIEQNLINKAIKRGKNTQEMMIFYKKVAINAIKELKKLINNEPEAKPVIDEPIVKKSRREIEHETETDNLMRTKAKTLFTWSGGPRSSGVGFFCFVSSRA